VSLDETRLLVWESPIIAKNEPFSQEMHVKIPLSTWGLKLSNSKPRFGVSALHFFVKRKKKNSRTPQNDHLQILYLDYSQWSCRPLRCPTVHPLKNYEQDFNRTNWTELETWETGREAVKARTREKGVKNFSAPSSRPTISNHETTTITYPGRVRGHAHETHSGHSPTRQLPIRPHLWRRKKKVL
jgi:hypothetical protein